MEPNQANPSRDAQRAAREAALKRIRSAALPAPDELANQLMAGNRVALGQAITLIESQSAADRPAADALLNRVLEVKHQAIRIGVTGVPGVGKSTFIEKWGLQLIEAGHRVAVLAVDPSSGRSHGSILGDKTRMTALSMHPAAFVRPSPAAEALGGVARATREVMALCEAAGFDRILVETVGVGQSETAVRDLTDIFLLLLLPGAGDELQGIKRGIMEMADLVWVNKADGEAAGRAVEAANQIHSALHLLPPPISGETVEALTGSGLTGLGLDELDSALSSLAERMIASGHLERQRTDQELASFDHHVRSGIWHSLLSRPETAAEWQRLQTQVLHKQISPYSAARNFIEAVASHV